MYTRDEYNDLVIERADALADSLADAPAESARTGAQELADALTDLSDVVHSDQAEIDGLVDQIARRYLALAAYLGDTSHPDVALPEAPGRVAVSVRLELNLTPEQAAVLFEEASARGWQGTEVTAWAVVRDALEPHTELFGRLL